MTTATLSTKRITSIDLLRGIVMIIMALDHVRDYFHASAFKYDPTDLDHTSVFIFFTRWITHYCAPVFVFLAGTSAYLVGLRKGKKYLSKFLFTRGIWLVLLEITVVTFGWHFDIHFNELDLQTIWSLGMSMIVLAGLIHLPKKVIVVIGLALIAGHNLLDGIHANGNGLDSFFVSAANEFHVFNWPPFHVILAYPLLAWIGVMTTGYCLGAVFVNTDQQIRKKLLLTFGTLAILLFIIIRGFNHYGDPHPWSSQKDPIFTFMSFLNVTKYPPSLCYVLMTIGPALIFLGLTENINNKFSNVFSVYGRVPMFYYLIHIYLIHLAAMVAAMFTGFKWSDMISEPWIGQSTKLGGYGFNLITVYLVWIALMVIIYLPCKWYDKYKQRNKDKWWLSYL